MTGERFVNLGMLGRTIPSSAPREIATATPDTQLWIMLGSNNLLEGLSAEEVGKEMDALLSSLLKNWQPDCIRLIAPAAFKPGTWVESDAQITESRKLRDAYKALAEKKGISFTAATDWDIPVEFDGVHFTADGHRIFAEKMRNTTV